MNIIVFQFLLDIVINSCALHTEALCKLTLTKVLQYTVIYHLPVNK